MGKAKFYDSAYPGSMCQRNSGGYVDREDSESLAAALLKNLYDVQNSMEDWKADAIRLEKELAEMAKECERLQRGFPMYAELMREASSMIGKIPTDVFYALEIRLPLVDELYGSALMLEACAEQDN